MTIDPRKRFSAAAGDYHKYRPSYPEAMIDWLLERSGVEPAAAIADIGCGTGIFSRQLSARDYRVTGIDPNAEMLDLARSVGGERFVLGEAERLAFRDNTFLLAVSAQAFHWFDKAAAISEMRRVVVPSGGGAAIWNCRSDTPFLRDYDGLIARYSTLYIGGSHWERAAGDVRGIAEPWQPEVREFPHRQFLDRDGFFGRTRSSSYVEHGIARKHEFEDELGNLFQSYAENEVIRIDYHTIVVSWRFPAS